MNKILDFFLNLDSHMFNLIVDYGAWVYAILFAIIFIETGVVVLPFLPGDSLLFAAGTFCAGVQNDLGQSAQLNLLIIIPLLIGAAFLGDSLNYYLGRKIGLNVLNWKIGNKTLISPNSILKTEHFFETHGPKTIILARFVPIIRTFAPFVAGIGNMHYNTFIRYNIIGGILWVCILVFVGYFFGNIPFVKNNFEIVILGIVVLSVVPVVIEFFKKRRESNKD